MCIDSLPFPPEAIVHHPNSLSPSSMKFLHDWRLNHQKKKTSNNISLMVLTPFDRVQVDTVLDELPERAQFS